MTDHPLRLAAFLATLGSGLMAGLFFAFSVAVMAALARAPGPEGANVMRGINVAILNPWFGAAFFGTALLSIILIGVALLRPDTATAWLAAGGILYLAGILGVTILFNVPLNNALAAADPASPAGAAVWARYLAEWVPWNHVRSVAGLASLACFAIGFRQLAA